MKGIDISEHNGAFNIAAARSQGAEFVIIRCGYGSNISSQDDKQYWANVNKCIANNMPFGIYLYAYAKNDSMARSEAEHTIRLLKDIPARGRDLMTLGVWYDVEDSSLPSGTTLVNCCKTYCQLIESAGYPVGIYATASWFINQLNVPALNPWATWVAHWGVSQPGFTKNMMIWQYTNPPSDIASPESYDWNIAYATFKPEEEEEMSEKEIQSRIDASVKPLQARLEALEKKYRFIEDVPEWWRDAVQYYVDQGIIKGVNTDKGKPVLNVTPEECRIYTVLYRIEKALHG